MKRLSRSLWLPAITVASAVFILVIGCAPAAQPAQPPAGAGDSAQGGVQPKYGGVLALIETTEAPTFDLHQESTVAVTSPVGPAYDNLVRFDPQDRNDAKIIPDLAEKWTISQDGASYTFTLRKGVQFHNGNPFTTADVKFSLERVMDPPKGIKSPRRPALEPIAAVEAPEDATVVIRLKRSYASLLPNLAQGWMAMYDQEWVKATGDDAPAKQVMGTGPFLFKQYSRGTEVLLEKNPNYWNKGRPYLDGIRILIVPDPNTGIAAFRTGQIHIHNGLNTFDTEKFKSEFGEKMVFERIGTINWGTLFMNTTRKPYDNPKVREALYLAISRQDAIKVVAQGDGLLGGYMRPGGPWSLPDEEIRRLPGYGEDKTQDLARAKQLLAEAGFPNGYEALIKTRQSQSYIDHAIFIVDQLKRIGVNATMKPYETAQIYDIMDKGDFDLGTWPGMAVALDDPDALYSEMYLCNSPRNWSRLCSPEVDELFAKQSRELDPAKRKALVLQMERTAVPQASKIITSWGIGRTAYYSFVKGYTRHAGSYNNIRHDQVWLDK
ncbi:MAG: hypothetical protein HYY02_08730 [Chloroflexi bacterium]|nr:hypothetical protein [Chloroflexota bacterium]